MKNKTQTRADKLLALKKYNDAAMFLELSKMQIEDIPIFTYSELDRCLTLIIREDLMSKMIQVLQELRNKQLIVDMTYVHYVSIISIIGHGVSDISLLSPILDKLRDVHVYTTFMFDNAYSIVTSSDRSVEVLTKIHDELIRQWQ
jgi:aspartokinase